MNIEETPSLSAKRVHLRSLRTEHKKKRQEFVDEFGPPEKSRLIMTAYAQLLKEQADEWLQVTKSLRGGS